MESMRQTKGTKDAFAHVHRAYYKDRKLEMLEQSSEGVAITSEREEEDNGDISSPLPESDPLLSLPGESSRWNVVSTLAAGSNGGLIICTEVR